MRPRPAGPVEEYLAAFARNLVVTPRRRRRVMEETEAHLRDATDDLVAGGVTRLDAERLAIARFGPPHVAAAQFGSSPSGRAWRRGVAVGHRLSGRRATESPPMTGQGGEPRPTTGAWPSPACDVCGRLVPAEDRRAVDVAAVGEIQSPVVLIVHAACHDMAAGVLALRGFPVALSHPTAP